MRANLVLLIVVLGFLGVAQQAAAETLHTTPNPGAAPDCSVAKPCALSTAMGRAADGDTVLVGEGTYSPAGSYADGGRNLVVKGAVIGPGRPVVEGNLVLTGPASRVTDLQIRADDPYVAALDLANGASADRMIAIGSQNDGCYVRGTGASIANSLCWFDGSESMSGLSSQGATVSGPMIARNVTAVGNFGVAASAGSSDEESALRMSNSIARSTQTTPQGRDIWFFKGLTTLKYTAFQTMGYYIADWSITDQLTDAAAFLPGEHFRQAPTSPTINAGSVAEASGELDLNGNLRTIGASTDMGAYEFVSDPPTALATPTTDITTTSATVNGNIDTRSGQTTYHLEYGPTEAHGSSTPERILPAASTPSAVSFNLEGLARESTVNYSIVATNEAGTVRSPKAAFATTAPKPPDPEPARTAGKVKLSCKRVKIAKKPRVRCAFSQSNIATGRTRLAMKRAGTKARVKGSAELNAKGRAVITLKLSRKGRYKATIVTPTPAGTSQTIQRTVTIR
ncbi:MAG TPA: choice-of-anchor Q domain-containing protein [Solirubrobacterales bacterium]|nr:choice-of-anchor Q domain-containing protein [Solirubrobacterales bacterium]